MKNFVIRILVNALALTAAAYFVDGIHIVGRFGDTLVVALVFGLVNALLKPIITLLSFPFLILSLGLFAFVINGAMLLVTARFTERLEVSGLWAAIVGSIVISLTTMVLGWLLEDGEKGS